MDKVSELVIPLNDKGITDFENYNYINSENCEVIILPDQEYMKLDGKDKTFEMVAEAINVFVAGYEDGYFENDELDILLDIVNKCNTDCETFISAIKRAKENISFLGFVF